MFLLLFGSLLLNATATRSGQWIALVFLFNNLLRTEEKSSVFSHLYITSRHYSIPILFIAVSVREENVWKEKQVLKQKVQSKNKAFLPWLLKCCALSWTNGHWLPECNQNQKLAKGVFVYSQGTVKSSGTEELPLQPKPIYLSQHSSVSMPISPAERTN